MGKSSPLGRFESLVLAALLQRDGSAYGVIIRQEIEARTGRTVSVGAIYTALKRLQGKGYVSSRLGEPTAVRGGRAKRFFDIEPRGVEALRASLHELSQMVEGLEGFGDLTPGSAT